MLQPLKRRNLYEYVIEQVKAHIADNDLRPGDRLPTENELAEKLEVSRSSVREAMKALQVMGVVSTRPRIGCVVRALDMKALAEHLSFRFEVDQASLYELLEARQLLETAVMPLVIERATEDHFAKMEESLRLHKQQIDEGATGVDADIGFHEALFEAAGNKVLQGFSEIIKEFFTGLRRLRLASRQLALETLAEHNAIYRAIRSGNVDDAREEMCKHLQRYLTTDAIRNTTVSRGRPSDLTVVPR
ncbi:MAG: hypothetical protein A2Z18_06830 [Armatimonadetes bacterium RBG_16_58_9]|nr:MAG: hypothetical protein A2Z18_06830 [Armatimonadetes bacterium RBG_16_58_9]